MAVRWGIVGCGDVARKRVAGAIQNDTDSELVAVCRRDETKLRQFSEEFGVAVATTSADELIQSPDIDAVYNPLPNHLHVDWTIKAVD